MRAPTYEKAVKASKDLEQTEGSLAISVLLTSTERFNAFWAAHVWCALTGVPPTSERQCAHNLG